MQRSEIFSFGSVLYEAATRTRAFSGPSILSIMHAIAAEDPPPPSKLRPELPREFDLIIERALSKERIGVTPRPLKWEKRCAVCGLRSPERGQVLR